MKKIYKLSLIALLFAIVMPFSLFLTGCGATPTNEALAVFFDSPIYDEETGLAVFAVDKNVNTELTYKVNPSSWGAYPVTYAIKECSPQNRSRFTLEDGKISIREDNFEDIKIDIIINGHVDTCIVTLKQYPTDVYMIDESGAEVTTLNIKLNAFGSYTINPIGRFVELNGVSYTKPLVEYEYNFDVTTSDMTIVQVSHENRLKISSERGQVGKAVVTVKLKNAKGEAIKTLTINVEVVLNAKNANVLLDGYDYFVKDGSEVEILASNLQKDAKNNHIIGYKMIVLSDDGRLIPYSGVEIKCFSSDGKNITLDNENSRFLVEPNANTELTFKITLSTNLIDENGNAYAMSFNVTVKY